MRIAPSRQVKSKERNFDQSATNLPLTLTPKDFLNLEKLANIPNDATVVFKPGKIISFSAYGSNYVASEFNSKRTIPGTDIPLPPVRLFTISEFYKLLTTVGTKNPLTVQACWDSTGKVIEAVIPYSTGHSPAPVTISAEQCKRLLGAIIHEARHAAGGNEFDAYAAENAFLVRVGVKPDFASSSEIMQHIINNYDFRASLHAMSSFEKVASQEEFMKFNRAIERGSDDIDQMFDDYVDWERASSRTIGHEEKLSACSTKKAA